MKTPNSDTAWAILIERQGERRENRPAFISALIYERVRDGNRDDQITPNMAEAFTAELTRLAKLIKAEAEAACNGERNPSQEAADEKNQARFAAIAEALGFEASTGGDPRGPCARLIDPDDRRGDGWGEGWAVY